MATTETAGDGTTAGGGTGVVRRDSDHPSLWRRTSARNDDWFAEDMLAEMRDYVRPLRRLRQIMAPVSLLAVVGFALADGGVWAIDLFGIDSGWFLQLVAVAFVFNLLTTLIGIGPSAWVALSYDKRHGVSNQTPGLFITDEVKDIVINTVVISLLFGAIYAAIHAFDSWWLLGWAIFFGFQVLMVFLYPVVIMPRFNKFTPMPEGPLRTRIEEVAALAETEIEGIYTMDGSKRSRRGNAFVAGFGKTKRVVVFDTITDWPIERIAQVVAHEIGHYRLKHTITTLPVLGVLTLGVFGLLQVVGDDETLLGWVGVDDIGDPAGFPLLVLAFGLAMGVLQIGLAFWSRYHERAADLEALELLGDPSTFVGMWPAFVEVNKAELEPTWWKRLNASHPEVSERMQFGADWAAANGVAFESPPKARVSNPLGASAPSPGQSDDAATDD